MTTSNLEIHVEVVEQVYLYLPPQRNEILHPIIENHIVNTFNLYLKKTIG